MAKCPKFPYQKLKHEGFCDEYEERQRFNIVKSRRWYGFGRVHIRKRFRLKVPSLGRFLRRRVKLVSAVRLSCAKVLKRLKEGQAHFGDLFAGNYLIMQVNPTPLKGQASCCPIIIHEFEGTVKEIMSTPLLLVSYNTFNPKVTSVAKQIPN
ncbi:hypothetical protein Peur_001128 [Populus x canadensis]